MINTIKAESVEKEIQLKKRTIMRVMSKSVLQNRGYENNQSDSKHFPTSEGTTFTVSSPGEF